MCQRGVNNNRRENIHNPERKFMKYREKSAMEAIDLLEKRIAALELQILPENPSSEAHKTQTITDLLIQTQTMITSALSCREAITSILQHMTTINEYLDPSTEASELEVEAKRHYLLELYPELKDTVRIIGNFENLVPFIDSSNILKVVELSGKLEQYAANNLSLYEESRQVTMKVLNSLQQYNDIQTSLKTLFAQLDTAVTDLEKALKPKFSTEE